MDLIIFTVEDPLGRKVDCIKRIWDNHILIRRNWSSENYWLKKVLNAIRDPKWIAQDCDREDRICYYGSSKRTTYMKVIVQFDDDKENGYIITAIEKDKGKSGEKILWPALEN